jgi:hypothetical protein
MLLEYSAYTNHEFYFDCKQKRPLEQDATQRFAGERFAGERSQSSDLSAVKYMVAVNIIINVNFKSSNQVTHTHLANWHIHNFLCVITS